MHVPGHEADCQCQWCLDGNIYCLMHDGTYINHSDHLLGRSARERVPPPTVAAKPDSPPTAAKPCLERRRGKPVIAKGKRKG